MIRYWIVVYIFQHIAMTIGPLPYDRSECIKRAMVKQDEIAEKFKYGLVLPKLKGDNREVTEKDVKVVCVSSPTKPAL